MAATPPVKGNRGPNNDSEDSNGWAEYRRLVLAEIERLDKDASTALAQIATTHLTVTQLVSEARSALHDKIVESVRQVDEEHGRKLERRLSSIKHDHQAEVKRLSDTLDSHVKEISALKAKATLFGAMAGFLVALVSALAGIFIRH